VLLAKQRPQFVDAELFEIGKRVARGLHTSILSTTLVMSNITRVARSSHVACGLEFESRIGGAHRMAPIDSLKQHRELRCA
jgi:hypothetical protein